MIEEVLRLRHAWGHSDYEISPPCRLPAGLSHSCCGRATAAGAGRGGVTRGSAVASPGRTAIDEGTIKEGTKNH